MKDIVCFRVIMSYSSLDKEWMNGINTGVFVDH
jgi:hypothetical protein